jgi:hypothetical protein
VVSPVPIWQTQSFPQRRQGPRDKTRKGLSQSTPNGWARWFMFWIVIVRIAEKYKLQI